MPLLSEMDYHTLKLHATFCYMSNCIFWDIILLSQYGTHTTKYLHCENTQYYVKHIIYAHKHYKKPQSLNY
jgi:hypothetical protein